MRCRSGRAARPLTACHEDPARETRGVGRSAAIVPHNGIDGNRIGPRQDFAGVRAVNRGEIANLKMMYADVVARVRRAGQ